MKWGKEVKRWERHGKVGWEEREGKRDKGQAILALFIISL